MPQKKDTKKKAASRISDESMASMAARYVKRTGSAAQRGIAAGVSGGATEIFRKVLSQDKK